MKLRTLSLFVFFGAALTAEPVLSPDAVLASYCALSRTQQDVLNGASMQVQIEAALPKLRKRGRLEALRHISRLGRITYDALKFEGDNTVKNNVIARFLSAEAQAQTDTVGSLTVTPENYRFKFKRMTEFDGRGAYIFQVSPRKKRVGLYKGELWIDAQTYMRIRESGRFVKNPSIFLKKIEFTRNYEIRDGIALPRQTVSVVYTRLVGPAQLTIDYTNYSLEDETRRAGLSGAADQ